MTQEQYNNFIEYLEYQITEAETIVADTEKDLQEKEAYLAKRRENSEWSSYGTILNQMQNLIRLRNYWIGWLRECRATLRQAKHYGAEE